MNIVASKTKIFLSHAAADIELVEAFQTLLTQYLGITSADIFCSSLSGQGAPKGMPFVDSIRAQAEAADAVVALITPAYLESAFCLGELGAAWVLQTQRFPVVVPPADFSAMTATLLGIVGVKLNDTIELQQMLEELGIAIKKKAPAAGVRGRAIRDFEKTWERDVLPILAGPKKIDVAVHKAKQTELEEAIKARDDAEDLLLQANKQIEALKKAKDKADVAKIENEFSDTSWQEEFDEIVREIRDHRSEVGGMEIIRLLILDRMGRGKPVDHLNYPDEADRAIELGIYDEERRSWNTGTEEVKQLYKLLDAMDDLFEEYPEAAKALKARGERSDPTTIKFWEEHL